MTRFAFFDIDGTLLTMNSMLDYVDYFFISYYGGIIGEEKSADYARRRQNDYSDYTREQLNKAYYQNFKGVPFDTLKSIGKKWFSNKLKTNPNLFNLDVLSKLKAHQKDGLEIIFVSGGCLASIAPLAELLGVKMVLCIEPKVFQEKLTGSILEPQTIGEGKAVAIKQLLAMYKKTDLTNSYAYGDHESDLAMMQLVGHPYVIGDDLVLLDHARNEQWPVITTQNLLNTFKQEKSSCMNK